MIIPTYKLIGSNLFGNIGHYWFDLIKYSLEQQPENHDLNFKPTRVRNCLAYLKSLGWEKWNQSYQTTDIGELYFSSLEDEKVKSLPICMKVAMGVADIEYLQLKPVALNISELPELNNFV